MGDLDAYLNSSMYDYSDEDKRIAKARRRGRKTVANRFRDEYFYGRCDDNKTCIWLGDRHSWSVKSYGITWLGVHGHDSICVVTKAGDMDVTRIHGFAQFASKEEVDCDFRRSVISELEDLADPSSKPLEMHDKSINKPFSVVSVVPVTNKFQDASEDVYEEIKAVKYRLEYLEKQIRGDEESGDDGYDFDYFDEDAFIKHSMKQERRRQRERGKPFMDYDEDTIKFLQDKLKRDAANPGKVTVQEPTDACNEKKAIAFLEEKMKKPAEHFSLEETIKTAISAF